MPFALITLLASVVASTSVAGRESTPRFSNVQLATGVRLHYAEAGPADGNVVILIHGLSDSWFSFSRVIPALASNNRVYALDLRGHGDSDRPSTGYRPSDLAADVIAFMDAKKIVRATILGHSMGSFVAQQVALAAPRRVRELILVGSATRPSAIGSYQELVAGVAQLTDPVSRDFVREFQLSTVHLPVGDAFIDRAVEESLKLPVRVWRDLVTGMTATEAPIALGRLGIPTLIMRGAMDIYALQSEQDALAKMIRTAKVKVYPETGHAPHWERPTEFVRDVLAFLAE